MYTCILYECMHVLRNIYPDLIASFRTVTLMATDASTSLQRVVVLMFPMLIGKLPHGLGVSWSFLTVWCAFVQLRSKWL